MSVPIQLKRGTRAQVNELALTGGLLVGEPLFITDEKQIVVADTVSTVTQNPHFRANLTGNLTTVSNYIVPLEAVQINSGFTANLGAGRMTAQIAGKYFVAAQMLVGSSGALYFSLRKNGSTICHAYNAQNSILIDMHVVTIVDLAVNDYIEMYQQGTTVSTYGGAAHSSFSAFRIA